MAKRILIIVALLLIGSAVGLYVVMNKTEPYRTFTRPDGKYQVVVYRKPGLLGRMPGQGSDAPGVVKLMDQSGRTLQEADVEMVQNVDRVDWDGRNVSIKLVAEWQVPD